jgi:hypothetical protein
MMWEMDAGEGSRTEIVRAVGYSQLSKVSMKKGTVVFTSLIILSVPIRITRNVLRLLLLLSASSKHLLEELELG